MWQRTEGPKPITGNLAGYVALLHLCGAGTVWHSAGVTLQPVLKREGDIIVCRKLGTRYPVAAA